jgi:type I restriction enzyme S subunit
MKLIALGEVCTIINGGTPDTKNSKFWDGKHAWITPAEMGNLKSPFLGSSRRTLTDEGMRNSSAQLLPKHSVIMSSRAPIGHLIINEVPMASNQGCKGLIPNETLNFKYLYYFLYANKEYLNELGSGTTFAEISGAKLKTVLIPLPSLEKQRDIVKKLDSAFAEIDLLVVNLGLGDEKINQLLQSILNTAFNQSSTFSEQSNLSATKDLDIKLIKLVDLCKLVGGGTPSKANSNYYSGGIPWATVRDMRSRWLEDTEHKINEAAVKESSTNVIPSGNVVLASRVGLGKVIQLKQDTAINQDLRALIPRENSKIDSNYLYYWTLSITPEIIAAGKGATVQGVTLPFLENLLVPLPSLDKQVEIAKKLDSAFGEIELLKARIKLEKDYIVSLRQSLLSKAFSQEEAVA